MLRPRETAAYYTTSESGVFGQRDDMLKSTAD